MKYYFSCWKIRKLKNVTTEAELYCAETAYGYGETLLEFEDGSMNFEKNCLELSFGSIQNKVFRFFFGLKYNICSHLRKNNNLDNWDLFQ